MKSLVVFAVAVIFGSAAHAQHQAFTVNPDASEVRMTVNTTHEVVLGAFHIQSGSIEFDRGAPKMSGTVVVLAGSGKTGNVSWEFLEYAHDPAWSLMRTRRFEPRALS
jgi:hypothetical protein